MSSIERTSTLPDSANKADFYSLIDSSTVGSIVNADIDASAGIVDTKLATISTANKVAITAIPTKDEDDMASDSAVHVPTQQSVKAYVDGKSIPVKASGAEIDTGTDDAKFATPKAIADSALVSETAWVDYSATSTIVGWTSFSQKKIRVKKIGSTVFVDYDIEGVSNAAGTTFTLPYSASAAKDVYFTGSATDNGGTPLISSNYINTGATTSTVNLFKDPGRTNFTNSGNKNTMGQFWYEAA